MELSFPTFRKLASGNRSRPFASLWPRYSTAAQRKALLRLVLTATEERLPLVPLLEAWEKGERGIQRKRLGRLIDALRQGVSLPHAVESVPGVLSDEEALTVRFGAESGMLATALRETLDGPALVPSRVAAELRRTVIYLSVVLFISMLVVTFLQIKIVPALLKIADDFSTSESRVLYMSVQMSEFVAGYGVLFVVPLAAISLFVFSANPGRNVRRALSRSLLSPWREWCKSELLNKLALASGNGRPLPGSISTLARYHFDRSLRHKLLYVRNEVELGAELWRSMASAGLLTTPEMQVLETAERVGNRSWVLQELALAKKRRITRRLESLQTLSTPLVILVFASFVLFQALSVFLTLLNYITVLT